MSKATRAILRRYEERKNLAGLRPNAKGYEMPNIESDDDFEQYNLEQRAKEFWSSLHPELSSPIPLTNPAAGYEDIRTLYANLPPAQPTTRMSTKEDWNASLLSSASRDLDEYEVMSGFSQPKRKPQTPTPLGLPTSRSFRSMMASTIAKEITIQPTESENALIYARENPTVNTLMRAYDPSLARNTVNLGQYDSRSNETIFEMSNRQRARETKGGSSFVINTLGVAFNRQVHSSLKNQLGFVPLMENLTLAQEKDIMLIPGYSPEVDEIRNSDSFKQAMLERGGSEREALLEAIGGLNVPFVKLSPDAKPTRYQRGGKDNNKFLPTETGGYVFDSSTDRFVPYNPKNAYSLSDDMLEKIKGVLGGTHVDFMRKEQRDAMTGIVRDTRNAAPEVDFSTIAIEYFQGMLQYAVGNVDKRIEIETKKAGGALHNPDGLRDNIKTQIARMFSASTEIYNFFNAQYAHGVDPDANKEPDHESAKRSLSDFNNAYALAAYPKMKDTSFLSFSDISTFFNLGKTVPSVNENGNVFLKNKRKKIEIKNELVEVNNFPRNLQVTQTVSRSMLSFGTLTGAHLELDGRDSIETMQAADADVFESLIAFKGGYKQDNLFAYLFGKVIFNTFKKTDQKQSQALAQYTLANSNPQFGERVALQNSAVTDYDKRRYQIGSFMKRLGVQSIPVPGFFSKNGELNDGQGLINLDDIRVTDPKKVKEYWRQKLINQENARHESSMAAYKSAYTTETNFNAEERISKLREQQEIVDQYAFRRIDIDDVFETYADFDRRIKETKNLPMPIGNRVNNLSVLSEIHAKNISEIDKFKAANAAKKFGYFYDYKRVPEGYAPLVLNSDDSGIVRDMVLPNPGLKQGDYPASIKKMMNAIVMMYSAEGIGVMGETKQEADMSELGDALDRSEMVVFGGRLINRVSMDKEFPGGASELWGVNSNETEEDSDFANTAPGYSKDGTSEFNTALSRERSALILMAKDAAKRLGKSVKITKDTTIEKLREIVYSESNWMKTMVDDAITNGGKGGFNPYNFDPSYKTASIAISKATRLNTSTMERVGDGWKVPAQPINALLAAVDNAFSRFTRNSPVSGAGNNPLTVPEKQGPVKANVPYTLKGQTGERLPTPDELNELGVDLEEYKKIMNKKGGSGAYIHLEARIGESLNNQSDRMESIRYGLSKIGVPIGRKKAEAPENRPALPAGNFASNVWGRFRAEAPEKYGPESEVLAPYFSEMNGISRKELDNRAMTASKIIQDRRSGLENPITSYGNILDDYLDNYYGRGIENKEAFETWVSDRGSSDPVEFGKFMSQVFVPLIGQHTYIKQSNRGEYDHAGTVYNELSRIIPKASEMLPKMSEVLAAGEPNDVVGDQTNVSSTLNDVLYPRYSDKINGILSRVNDSISSGRNFLLGSPPGSQKTSAIYQAVSARPGLGIITTPLSSLSRGHESRFRKGLAENGIYDVPSTFFLGGHPGEFDPDRMDQAEYDKDVAEYNNSHYEFLRAVMEKSGVDAVFRGVDESGEYTTRKYSIDEARGPNFRNFIGRGTHPWSAFVDLYGTPKFKRSVINENTSEDNRVVAIMSPEKLSHLQGENGENPSKLGRIINYLKNEDQIGAIAIDEVQKGFTDANVSRPDLLDQIRVARDEYPRVPVMMAGGSLDPDDVDMIKDFFSEQGIDSHYERTNMSKYIDPDVILAKRDQWGKIAAERMNQDPNLLTYVDSTSRANEIYGIVSAGGQDAHIQHKGTGDKRFPGAVSREMNEDVSRHISDRTNMPRTVATGAMGEGIDMPWVKNTQLIGIPNNTDEIMQRAMRARESNMGPGERSTVTMITDLDEIQKRANGIKETAASVTPNSILAAFRRVQGFLTNGDASPNWKISGKQIEDVIGDTLYASTNNHTSRLHAGMVKGIMATSGLLAMDGDDGFNYTIHNDVSELSDDDIKKKLNDGVYKDPETLVDNPLTMQEYVNKSANYRKTLMMSAYHSIRHQHIRQSLAKITAEAPDNKPNFMVPGQENLFLKIKTENGMEYQKATGGSGPDFSEISELDIVTAQQRGEIVGTIHDHISAHGRSGFSSSDKELSALGSVEVVESTGLKRFEANAKGDNFVSDSSPSFDLKAIESAFAKVVKSLNNFGGRMEEINEAMADGTSSLSKNMVAFNSVIKDLTPDERSGVSNIAKQQQGLYSAAGNDLLAGFVAQKLDPLYQPRSNSQSFDFYQPSTGKTFDPIQAARAAQAEQRSALVESSRKDFFARSGVSSNEIAKRYGVSKETLVGRMRQDAFRGFSDTDGSPRGVGERAKIDGVSVSEQIGNILIEREEGRKKTLSIYGSDISRGTVNKALAKRGMLFDEASIGDVNDIISESEAQNATSVERKRSIRRFEISTGGQSSKALTHFSGGMTDTEISEMPEQEYQQLTERVTETIESVRGRVEGIKQLGNMAGKVLKQAADIQGRDLLSRDEDTLVTRGKQGLSPVSDDELSGMIGRANSWEDMFSGLAGGRYGRKLGIFRGKQINERKANRSLSELIGSDEIDEDIFSMDPDELVDRPGMFGGLKDRLRGRQTRKDHVAEQIHEQQDIQDNQSVFKRPMIQAAFAGYIVGNAFSQIAGSSLQNAYQYTAQNPYMQSSGFSPFSGTGSGFALRQKVNEEELGKSFQESHGISMSLGYMNLGFGKALQSAQYGVGIMAAGVSAAESVSSIAFQQSMMGTTPKAMKALGKAAGIGGAIAATVGTLTSVFDVANEPLADYIFDKEKLGERSYTIGTGPDSFIANNALLDTLSKETKLDFWDDPITRIGTNINSFIPGMGTAVFEANKQYANSLGLSNEEILKAMPKRVADVLAPLVESEEHKKASDLNDRAIENLQRAGLGVTREQASPITDGAMDVFGNNASVTYSEIMGDYYEQYGIKASVTDSMLKNTATASGYRRDSREMYDLLADFSSAGSESGAYNTFERKSQTFSATANTTGLISALNPGIDTSVDRARVHDWYESSTSNAITKSTVMDLYNQVAPTVKGYGQNTGIDLLSLMDKAFAGYNEDTVNLMSQSIQGDVNAQSWLANTNPEALKAAGGDPDSMRWFDTKGDNLFQSNPIEASRQFLNLSRTNTAGGIEARRQISKYGISRSESNAMSGSQLLTKMGVDSGIVNTLEKTGWGFEDLGNPSLTKTVDGVTYSTPAYNINKLQDQSFGLQYAGVAAQQEYNAASRPIQDEINRIQHKSQLRSFKQQRSNIETNRSFELQQNAISYDRMTTGHEYQRWQTEFNREAQLQERGWTREDWGYQDWQSGFQRETSLLQRDWSRSDNKYSATQRASSRSLDLSQRQWAVEDQQFNRQVSGLQFSWSMEDFDENIRFSSGRERKNLIKQRDRAVTTQNLEEGQTEKQNSRQAKVWAKQDEMWTKESDHISEINKRQEDLWAREDEMWTKEKSHIETIRNRQEEVWKKEDKQYTKQKEYSEKLMALDLLQYNLTVAQQTASYNMQKENLINQEKDYKKLYKLQKDQIDLQRSYEDKQIALQLASIANSQAQLAEQRKMTVGIKDFGQAASAALDASTLRAKMAPLATAIEYISNMVDNINNLDTNKTNALEWTIDTLDGLDTYRLQQLRNFIYDINNSNPPD